MSYLPNRSRFQDIHFISDNSNWVINREGLMLSQAVEKHLQSSSFNVITDASYLFYQTIHFGSLWSFVKGYKRVDSSNRMIITVYHGSERYPDAGIQEGISILLRNLSRFKAVITTNNIMYNRFIDWGIEPNTLHFIPLGVDLDLFSVTPGLREKMRLKLGIPENAWCIGSFQKDGCGWGEGNEPKLIKGPDIFVNVINELKQKWPVFVLLTGPARGYIKNELSKLKVPFHHVEVENFKEMPSLYHCLDVCLITSREEGGPKQLLESMATGVPIISSPVGMASDIINHGHNGFLFNHDNLNQVGEYCSELMNNKETRKLFIQRNLAIVRKYNSTTMAEKLCREVYKPLVAL